MPTKNLSGLQKKPYINRLVGMLVQQQFKNLDPNTKIAKGCSVGAAKGYKV